MSKKILLVLVASASLLHAAHSITVTIPEVKQIQGDIRAALIDNEKSYTSKSNYLQRMVVPVTSTVTMFSFDNVDPGSYVIQLFHDANQNEKMDMGLFGPKEPYGFSNNPQVKKKPKYSEVTFDSKEETAIVIELKNQ